MSTGALPHLLQRLHRRYALAMLRARRKQLADCVHGLQMQIIDEQADLQSMQLELRRVNAQLAHAAEPAAAMPRTGWGQP